MARAEHLPIYKRTYDLCLYLEQVERTFSRYHKYSLGEVLHDGAGGNPMRRAPDCGGVVAQYSSAVGVVPSTDHGPIGATCFRLGFAPRFRTCNIACVCACVAMKPRVRST